MSYPQNKIIYFLKKIFFITTVIALMFTASLITVIVRERQLYNLPNKVSLNSLAKLVNHERTPFVYIRKSGTYFGNIPSLDTPFFIGPITQTYTATLILNLVAKGIMSLDDPIMKYFQHNALPFTDAVTIKHLLSHRSGIIEKNQMAKLIKIYQEPKHNFTLEELIKDYTSYNPEAVGIVYFSDTGYYILGKIIEQITETSFEKYLYSEIIEKLSLKNTCIYLYDLNCNPVRGYANLEHLGLGEGHQTLTDYTAFMTSSFASGNLASSARDLQTFMKHLVDGTFFDFKIIEETGEEFGQELSRNEDEKIIGRDYSLGIVNFGKNRYGHGGQTIESRVQVTVEKDSGSVYLYYFGDPGILR